MGTARSVFNDQRQNAKRRGVAFKLTFEQWKSWWRQQLGVYWFQKRGRGLGRYQMCRIDDKGSYCLGNIKCSTHEENVCEQDRTKEEFRAAMSRASAKSSKFKGHKHDAKFSIIIAASNRRRVKYGVDRTNN
jgi:hypothetical protein